MVIPQTGKHPLWWRAVTSFSDNDGGRWSFSLRYQAEKTSVWSSWSPLNHCYQRPAVFEKNTWRDNEEHWGRLFENIAIFPLNMCLAEQRKTAFNLRVIFCSRWFTGNFPAARDSPQTKTPRKIHKNEIYRAPICPHHPGVEETIHSIWGKSQRKATLSYFATDSSFSSVNLSKISHLLL